MQKRSALFRLAVLLLAMTITAGFTAQAAVFAAMSPCAMDAVHVSTNGPNTLPVASPSMPCCKYSTTDCVGCAFCVPAIVTILPDQVASVRATAAKRFSVQPAVGSGLTLRPAIPPPIAFV